MEKGSSPCIPEKERPALEKPGKPRDRPERRGQSCAATPGMQSEVPHRRRRRGEPRAGRQEGALAELAWGTLGWMPVKTEICWFEGASHGSWLPDIRLQLLLSAPCFDKYHNARVRKTTEILTAQPPSPLGTEYFPSSEEQLRPAAFLNKSRKTAGARRHRGRVPAHCLNSACTTHDQFKSLPNSSQTWNHCLFTAPLPVSHVAFAFCLTNVADQVKLELPDSKTWHPWVKTPLPSRQLIAHSRTTPFSYHPWGRWPNATVGRNTESAKHF